MRTQTTSFLLDASLPHGATGKLFYILNSGLEKRIKNFVQLSLHLPQLISQVVLEVMPIAVAAQKEL